jgi:CubicO group peptidase (beta-lactamase class C family)
LLTPQAEAGGERKAGVAEVLQPFVKDRALAGAVVLVADKDKVLALEAVGYADIEDNRLMKTDALFWIASMSKPITAAALMMLIDAGLVRLDDPIEKHLPEFKGLWVAVEQDKEHILLKRPKTPVTVRHILAHTSGMPFASPMELNPRDQLVLRDAVLSYAMTPLQSEPGAKYQYSNSGINTAGRIIEVVSGRPYEVFLQERLFEPLGMRDTTFWPTETQLKRLARTYKPDAKKTGLEATTITPLSSPLHDRKRQPMPGGGLFSTAHDVARFCQMVLGGGVFEGKRYLSESAVREMSTKQTGDLKESYGLGWTVSGTTFGHGGAFATNMSIDTKRGLITVFMVQHNGFPGNGAKALPAFRKAAEERFGGSGN